MGASDWVTTEQAVTLDGKSLTVRRLGKVEIFAIAEAYIIEQELRLIQQHAASMPDAERSAFVDRQHAKLPRGLDLTLAAGMLFADGKTPDVVLARMVRKAAKEEMPESEVLRLFEAASAEELGAAIGYILGTDKKKL